MSEDKLSIGKCGVCKRYFKEEKLEQVEVIEARGNGVVRLVRFLCNSCKSSLEGDEGVLANNEKKGEKEDDR